MIEHFGKFMPILMHASLTLALMGITAWGLFRILKCRSPKLRRFVCSVTLLQGWMFLTLPVSMPTVVPQAISNNVAVKTILPVLDTPMSLIHAAQPGDFPDRADGSRKAVGSHPETGRSSTRSQIPGVDWATVVMLVWLIGMAACVIRHVSGYCRFVRHLPLGLAVDRTWEDEWQTVLHEMGIDRRIPMRISTNLGPLLCRLPAEYCLVLPADVWQRFTSTQRLAILRHEAAHLRRGDVWKSLLVRVLVLPHWFNPLSWWAVREFEECAEWACDDEARRLSLGQEVDYARALLRMGCAEMPPALLGAAVQSRGLVMRVRRLLNFEMRKESKMKKWIVMGVVACLSLCGMIRIEPAAQGQEPAPLSNQEAAPLNTVTFSNYGSVSAGFAFAEQKPSPNKVDVVNTSKDKTEAVSPPITGRQLGQLRSSNEAVIDIAYIFKNYDEFEKQRLSIKTEVDNSRVEMLKLSQSIRNLVDKVKALDRDADNFRQTEMDLETQIDAQKKQMEKSQSTLRTLFANKEAQMYDTVYRQIQREVAVYAKQHGIRIVHRINRSDFAATAESSTANDDQPLDRREVIGRVNRHVVYVDDELNDITDEILKRLQQQSDENQ